MARIPRSYERRGLLAIDPRAFFELFFMEPEAPANDERDPRATIVTIRGPLDQHKGGWCDSYEAILERVAEACECPAPAIVLKVDSPGGEAAGCFDCAREIRAMCARAGKQLVSYVEGQAGSAAYAIASVASKVILSDVGIVGSIGVISTRPDYSVQNAMRGFSMGFIASGARKIDGHPDAPTTPDELAAMQALVDSMALVFFELVSESRGLSVAAIAALEAGVFHGQAARAAGLADESMPFRTTLASLASWKAESVTNNGAQAMGAKAEDKKDDNKQAAPFDTVRSALEEMAKGDDANAARAKKALAVFNAEGEDEPDGDEAAEGTEEKPAAAAATPPEEQEPAAAAAAMRVALKAQATVDRLRAELASEREVRQRDELIASRPDLSKEMKALLKKSPLALVKETLAEMDPPAAPAPAAKAAKGGVSALAALAALQPGAPQTRGETQGDGVISMLPPAEKAALDRHFGLGVDPNAPKAGNIDASSPFKLTLGGAVHAPPSGLETPASKRSKPAPGAA